MIDGLCDIIQALNNIQQFNRLASFDPPSSATIRLYLLLCTVERDQLA